MAAAAQLISELLETGIPTSILDDLSSRFIINVPEEERKDVVRLCFQVELAHWFYLDIYCAESAFLKPCGIREFARIIFRHIPSLREHVEHVDEILEEWRDYKRSVPTYGAVMLDETLENVLLVQSYFAKASWGFPKGKVNEEEEPHDCAAREVLEETGYDISGLMDQHDYLEENVSDQLVRLYVVSGIPKETEFKARTKNEIKSYRWFPVASLPIKKRDPNCKTTTTFACNAFYMVIPFVRKVRKWIWDRQVRLANVVPAKRQRSKITGDARPFADESAASPKLVTTSLGHHHHHHRHAYVVPPRMVQDPPPSSVRRSLVRQLANAECLDSASPNHEEEGSKTWRHFRLDREAIMKAFTSVV